MGEREYWHTEREDWGVLTWEEGNGLVKRAWAVDGEDMAVVEASIQAEVGDNFIRTVDELIRGVTLI